MKLLLVLLYLNFIQLDLVELGDIIPFLTYIILIWINGIESFAYLWLQLKILLVVFLTIYHEYLGKCIRLLKLKENTKSSKFFRIINEIPTILLIFIVFIVVFKPI